MRYLCPAGPADHFRGRYGWRRAPDMKTSRENLRFTRDDHRVFGLVSSIILLAFDLYQRSMVLTHGIPFLCKS